MTARKGMAWGLVLALAASSVASAAGVEGGNRINRIIMHGGAYGAVVEIRGEQSPSFTTFKQNQPRQVIVDVAGATLSGVPASIPGDGNLVDAISARQIGSPSNKVSRVSIRLLKGAEYTVSIRGGSLFVRLTEGDGGVIASAGVPTWDGSVSDTAGGQGRDLALADELSAPGGARLPEADDEPSADDETAGGRNLEAPAAAGTRVQPPPPPVGVVSGTVDAPARPVGAPEPGPEPKAPGASRHDGGRVPAVQTPSAGKPLLVAQAEAGEDVVEEVEEVEEVPVETMEGKAATAPEAEDAVPPPPPTAAPTPAAAPAEVKETVPPPPPRETPVERVEVGSAVKNMTWVGFQQTQESSRVFVKTNAPVRYRLYEEGDRLVVLELENTRIPVRNNRRFLDTHFFETAVTMITPREIEGATASVRIEIEVRQRVPFRATQEDNMLYVSFERPR